MSHSADSKQAQAYLIDPMNAPEPSAETGPGAHFGSTFAPAKPRSTHSPSSSLSSNNPFRESTAAHSPPTKTGANVSERPLGRTSPKDWYVEGPPRRSGENHRLPPTYDDVAAGSSRQGRRRNSSLRERFPGDDSVKPLDVIRRDSKKAHRSPHLNKRHIPGADMVDRLDPALGGIAYHHEGPYDAALLARNTSYKSSPVAALETTNQEALKATPRENIKDAVSRHVPLDGTAVVPPGEQDKFGRTYHYQEGADLMHEGTTSDPGYKRWPGKEYDPEDLKGQAEPGFSLDRALRTHKIDDDGIEMEDRAHIDRDYHKAERKGTLDARDPVEIAGNDREYADLARKNAKGEEVMGGLETEGLVKRTGSLRHAGEGLKKRIGSLIHKNHDD